MKNFDGSIVGVGKGLFSRPLIWVIPLGGHIGSTAPGNFIRLFEFPKAAKELALGGGQPGAGSWRSVDGAPNKDACWGAAMVGYVEVLLLPFLLGFTAVLPRKNGCGDLVMLAFAGRASTSSFSFGGACTGLVVLNMWSILCPIFNRLLLSDPYFNEITSDLRFLRPFEVACSLMDRLGGEPIVPVFMLKWSIFFGFSWHVADSIGVPTDSEVAWPP